MSAISGSALWKPKARWLMRRILELRPSRRPWRVQAGSRRGCRRGGCAGCGRVGRRAATWSGRPRPARRRGAPGRARVGQVVEQPQFLAQQKGAVEALVDLADPVELGEL